jgi:ABC-type multidrug transport system ATPase subunit
MSPSKTPPTVLAVKRLRFDWPQRPQLFDGLSFDIPAGVSLVRGDGGSGKSTLLALLAGALDATEGSITLQGTPHGTSANTDVHRKQVFWIDPQTQAHDALTPQAFWKLQARQFPSFNVALVADLAVAFSLEPHLEKPLYMLSTGSRRKVWWVAAFASGARLVLLDQPFAALDGPSCRFLRGLLQEAAQNHNTAWLLADYEAPEGVALQTLIDL